MHEQLKQRASTAGQRAIRHYINEEQDQFLIHAAICLELLGKSKLAMLHPSLIIEKDFDSMLHVCGGGKHSKRPPWNIKTITATEVLRRCIQLQPALSEFSARLTLLAEFRNSALHIGEIGGIEARQFFHSFLASAALISDDIGIMRQEFFGEFEELVSTHLDQSVEDVKKSVAEKMARSKDVFQRRYQGLDADQLQVVLKAIEGGYSPSSYEDQLTECPACKSTGMLSGSYEVEWEADYDDDGIPWGGYPVVTLTPTSFECNACDLRLNSASELKAVAMGDTINIEDVDPADFYDEPDY